MAQPSVLVIEDSATVRRMIGDTLIARGHKVSLADNMDDALDSFAEMQADVVITDIFMPGTSGLDGIGILRTRWPSVPVIAISAGIAGERAQDALAAARTAGADAVMKKPFEMAEIAAKVDEVVQNRAVRKRVLIVDDSSTIRKVVSRCLDSEKYRVTTAESVEAAIESPDIVRVDVVITDIFMPRIGGLEGIKIYREHWPNCRIIAMSAGFDEKMSSSLTLQAAVKSGVDGVLKKPLTGDDLTRLVGDLC